MQQDFVRLRTRAACRVSLLALVLVLLGTTTLSALPAKGTQAPQLNSLSLLQAPAGANASWASLKGKVVVLEFWATWCSPCIAGLPHFNQLVASLDPARFQFLSIDDEDTKAVQTFLTKKKMSGWVGVDTTGSVYKAYGIKSRPTGVIIDQNGKVVAVTGLDSVTAADLEAVAAGKKVTFKPPEDIVEASAPTKPAAEQPLFSVTVSQAAPDQKQSQVNHPPTGTDFLGVHADGLLTTVFDVFSNRYALKGEMPAGHFNLRMTLGDASQTLTGAAVQQAVLAALHLKIEPKTITKPAYILRATDASKTLLSPSASTHSVKRGYWHGIYILMNGSMDDLAYVLGTGLETPVINETGIDGTYDARFTVEKGDVDSVNAVLKATLGLELVPGGPELPITVLEVSKQSESKTSASTETQSTKH
jgi:thiol-disulfide isomerase/thioredoxin